MRSVQKTTMRLGMLGAAVLVAGGGLLGTAIAASGATPTLSFTPNTNIGANQAILVTATGFTPHTKGGLSQCNVTPGEPTIADATTGEAEPVSCEPFNPIKTTSKGGIPNPTGYGIQAGVNGPPASGTDSAGTDANADAQNYPCPPTAAQVAAGGSCAMVLTDTLGETASEAIDYNFESTTTTTAAPAQGCTPAAGTITTGGATLNVDPATCLVGNEQVTVTGSGLKDSSLGTLLECNTTTTQPTVYVSLASKNIPVSCSALTAYLVTTSSSGGLPTTTFTVIVGTTGPPGSGTDSAGVAAATDAANYPCPPTAAQIAAGADCTLTFGDQGGDQVSVPLSFGGGPALPPPTKSSTATTAKPAASAAATKASSGSLAFTGTGVGLWILGLVGLALVVIGGSLLVLVDAPRRLLAVALHRGDRP